MLTLNLKNEIDLSKIGLSSIGGIESKNKPTPTTQPEANLPKPEMLLPSSAPQKKSEMNPPNPTHLLGLT